MVVAGSIAFAATAAPTSAAPPAPSAQEHLRLFQWRPFLAPFHAVVLHFPIGFVTIAFLLEIYRLFRPSDELRRVTMLVLWLSLVTGVISATLGIMRATDGGYENHALDLHRKFGMAVPVATVLTLLLQKLAYRNESIRIWSYAYRTVLTSTVGLLVIAGHYGGNLTHGSKYLVENAPQFVRELVEPEEDTDPGLAAGALNEKQRAYTEKVLPILSTKCYSCHGAEKQKGGYRMDKPDLALKGGESGKVAIKPGDPVESHLIRLILLPPQHDDVMPPEGKQPLTIEEIMILVDWIRNGATFPDLPAGETNGVKIASTNGVASSAGAPARK